MPEADGGTGHRLHGARSFPSASPLGPLITLVDPGIGNLRSLERAFVAVGARVERTADPARVSAAARLVLPGVGAFGACADALRERGLDTAVVERARAGVPLLGVCVGMQLLFDASEERGEHCGLGLIGGRVVRFADRAGRKVPHTGWNVAAPSRPHPVVPGAPAHVYFVHSYHAIPTDPAAVLAAADYGEPVVAAVAHANVAGVQFHPEKSGAAGLDWLRRFAAWVPTATLACTAEAA